MPPVMTLVLSGMIFGVAFAAPQGSAPPAQIAVTAPMDLKDVQALNNLLTDFSQKVTSCVERGGEIATCRCRYPHEAQDLRTGYAKVLKQHPNWKDRALSYEYLNRERRRISGVLSLDTLRRQLEMLKCQ